MGDFDAAISDYLMAVELGEDDDSILNNLCWDLGITGQAEDALTYCEKAFKANPKPSYRDSRGVTYAQLGMIEEAISDFQAVVNDLKGTTDSKLKAIAAERQAWLILLEAGENPITPEVLAKLRDETRAVTTTLTPVPDTTLISRSSLQKSAVEKGFTFEKVDVSGSEERLTGSLVEGSCKVVLELVGPETGVIEAALQATDCSDREQSGFALWFMGELLPGKREHAKAMVFVVMDVYYVIEGDVDLTGKKEIGNVIFEARRSNGSTPVFEITAQIMK